MKRDRLYDVTCTRSKVTKWSVYANSLKEARDYMRDAFKDKIMEGYSLVVSAKLRTK